VNFIWQNVLGKNRKKESLSHCLKLNYLFQDLSRREIELVSNIVHKRTFRAGEPIFHQGEIGVGMFIVMKGVVDIFVQDANKMDPNERVFITRLENGDFFGELALIEDNSVRSATAVSQTDSILLGFFRPDLLEIVNRSPACGSKIVLRLCEVLGKRLLETTDKVSELARELRELQSITQENSEHGHSKTFTT